MTVTAPKPEPKARFTIWIYGFDYQFKETVEVTELELQERINDLAKKGCIQSDDKKLVIRPYHTIKKIEVIPETPKL